MSPSESALIDEYENCAWRDRVRSIAAYDFHGIKPRGANWWQVHDLHMMALGFDDPRRDYSEDGG